jgi:hypothetical protein
MSHWVDSEFGLVDLGDIRRNKRLRTVAQGMWQAPQASVQGACTGWAEAKGAYRLFESEDVTPEAILSAHYEQTIKRSQLSGIILHIQDTTELDFSKKKALQGTGPLSELSRRGFFVHSDYLVQADGLPLGLGHCHIHARSDEEHGQSQLRKQQPIQEKESYRWLEGYRRACQLCRLSPRRRIISMTDREGDIYEIYDECEQRKQRGEPYAHWIIRCNQDRTIQPVPEDQAFHTHIKAAIAAAPILGGMKLKIRAKEQCKKVKGNRRLTLRSARLAKLEIRVCQVELVPPWRPADRKLSPTKVWVVMAQEIDPPAGEDAIQWILLTDLKVRTLRKALQVLELYSKRWSIEVFHKILKSGCRVENNQLKDSDRLLPRIALQLVMAWRIHYLTLLGRACPTLPCGVVFESCEWKPLVVIFRGKAHQDEEPSLSQMIQWIGSLGGHLNRKNDGPPGPQAIWKGMFRVLDFALLWEALH